ncbi:MAG: DMT family transporter [Gammaproteobacteria bacterium]|nr:DMT family transporter [Gammaproteobacteria bacterium]
MDRQTLAYLFAVATVLAWSTVATAFKLSLEHLEPPALLAWSSLASLLVLAAVAAARGGLGLLARWRGRDYALSALLGLLNPGLYYAVLFEAYDRLPAQQAQPLNYAWPVVLVLMSALFLKQPLRWRTLAAMAVCLLGVAVISTRGELLALRFTDPLGVTLALLSTVVWASYWLLNLRDLGDPVVRLAVSFAFGCLFAFLYAAQAGGLAWPSSAGLIGAAYVGTFEMGLTFVMWITALRLSRTTAQVSALVFLAPFLSLVVIHFVLGETIHPSTVVGLVLIVGGIAAIQRSTRLTAPA